MLKRWLLSRLWLWEPILYGEINGNYHIEYESYCRETLGRYRHYGSYRTRNEPNQVDLFQSYRHIIYGTIIGIDNKIMETLYTTDTWCVSKRKLVSDYLEDYDRSRDNNRRKKKAD